MRKYIALAPKRKGIVMPEIRDRILDLFLHLTAEQQELAADFAQSMLEAEKTEVPAEQEKVCPQEA